MKRLFAVCLGAGLLVRVGSAVVIPVNCNLFFNGNNAVQIAWMRQAKPARWKGTP